MTYCAKTDLDERFGVQEIAQLSDKDGDNVEDPGVIDQAIADATNTIDGYVATRYSVPLTPIPEAIKTAACHLARFFLYTHSPPDHVVDRRNETVRWLRDVANGTVTLPPDTGGTAPGANAAAPEAVPPVDYDANPHRTMTYESTQPYVERYPGGARARWRDEV